jgi:putative transposase
MTAGTPMTPRYWIDPADRIVLGGGQILTCKGLTQTGYLLQPFGTDLTDHVSFEQFEEARQHPDFRQDPLFYTEPRSRARARTLIESNDGIPAEELPEVRWREACVRAFHDEEAKDRRNPPPAGEQRVNRTQAGYGEAMRRAGPRLMQLDCAKKATAKEAAQKRPSLTKSGKRRKVRAGRTVALRSLPGAKTLQRWTLGYEEAGCEAWGVRQCHCNSGNHEPRFTADEYAFMLEGVYAYLDLKRPTFEQCYKDYEDALAAENEKRAANGQPPLRKIGASTYRARVKRIPRFNRDAARHGIEYAIRKNGGVRRKFDVTRIGERVEIDGCKVSLIHMAVESGLWEKMTAEQKETVPKERYILLRAIDVASKCIVAEVITPTETTKAAAVLLRMMISDKTPLASAMGAKTPWDYACVPHSIATDGGAAFRSDRFRQMLADLGIVFVAPQVGQPNKRATVERSFGTTRTQCLQHFTGQTFANIGDKGDYDPGKNASLFVDELARALVLYDVDIYHNTPHEGLYGETPRACWQRLMRESGCSRVTPGAHQQRAIFGIHLSRKVGKRGIRVLGLHYQSVDLAALLANEGEIDLPVRVDPDDLGWISVQIGRVWKTIPCATSGLAGASIQGWLSVVEDQRRRHAIAAAASRSIVADALRQIRAIAAKAERRFSIAPHTYDDDAISRAEAEMLRGFDVPEDRSVSHASPGSDPLAQGIPVTGPTVQQAEPSAPPRRQRPKAEPPPGGPPSDEDGRDEDDSDWTMETPDA